MYIIALQTQHEIEQLSSAGFKIEVILNDKLTSLFGEQDPADAVEGSLWVGFWVDCDPLDVLLK